MRFNMNEEDNRVKMTPIIVEGSLAISVLDEYSTSEFELMVIHIILLSLEKVLVNVFSII